VSIVPSCGDWVEFSVLYQIAEEMAMFSRCVLRNCVNHAARNAQHAPFSDNLFSAGDGVGEWRGDWLSVNWLFAIGFWLFEVSASQRCPMFETGF